MTEENREGAAVDGAGGILSLAELLNIFYRWRWLVVGMTLGGLGLGIAYGLLASQRYSARAQVRPGVVAYAADGTPLREWALEDVVRWFRDANYWSVMQEQPEFADLRAPTIDAEFIPSLNFVPGGNVVTLETFSTDPHLARLILDRSVDAFNATATMDTLGSTVYLTRRRLALDMERVRRDMERLAGDEERTRLEIAQRERDRDMLQLERRGLELDLAELDTLNAWRRAAARTLRAEIDDTRPRLAEAERLLAAVVGDETGAAPATPRPGGDPMTEVLLQTAGREQAGRVGELLVTVNRLGRTIVNAEVRADSFDTTVKTAELQAGRLRDRLEIELAKKEADVNQAIRDLQIKLERDLPNDRARLQNDLQNFRLRRDVVSPLERVGVVSVSERPVRPRKARAALILAFLGFCGSLALTLMAEYVVRNRDVITAPRR